MQVRVSAEAEIEGLDMPEFGALCYPDFVMATTSTGGHAPTSSPPVTGAGAVPGREPAMGTVPALGQHTEAVLAEFLPGRTT